MIVLKQCGQMVTIVLTSYRLKVSMFCAASVWYRYSLPMRLAGSPVHVSSLPRMAKSTPALFKTDAIDLATLWLRCSSAAVQPTQKSTSASGWSARVLIFRPSAQSVRVKVVPRQGWPRCSMLTRAFMPDSGISAFSMTR